MSEKEGIKKTIETFESLLDGANNDVFTTATKKLTDLIKLYIEITLGDKPKLIYDRRVKVSSENLVNFDSKGNATLRNTLENGTLDCSLSVKDVVDTLEDVEGLINELVDLEDYGIIRDIYVSSLVLYYTIRLPKDYKEMIKLAKESKYV